MKTQNSKQPCPKKHKQETNSEKKPKSTLRNSFHFGVNGSKKAFYTKQAFL